MIKGACFGLRNYFTLRVTHGVGIVGVEGGGGVVSGYLQTNPAK